MSTANNTRPGKPKISMASEAGRCIRLQPSSPRIHFLGLGSAHVDRNRQVRRCLTRFCQQIQWRKEDHDA
jgi:hypothetical protein